MKKLSVALLVLTVSGSALAQQNPIKPENYIKWRQSAYATMGWSMGRIKANLEPFNKDEVAKAANVIQAIANSGMGMLYVAGTEHEVNGVKTKVKPELFTDGEGVKKVAMAFGHEANEMARVAATGDEAAIKAQYAKLGGACKECHKNYRND